MTLYSFYNNKHGERNYAANENQNTEHRGNQIPINTCYVKNRQYIFTRFGKTLNNENQRKNNNSRKRGVN